jgi:peptide/nickel transport system permease protein
MARTLARKTALYALALFAAVSLNFGLIHLMPGDPLIHLLGEEGYAGLSGRGPEALAAIKETLGMTGPLSRQYGLYLRRIVAGDWGWSYHYGQPVAQVIGIRMQWTLLLLAPAALISTALGGWLGAWSGWRSRRKEDRLLSGLFLCLYSVPGYCLGMLLLIGVAHTNVIPIGGMMHSSATPWETLRYLLPPMMVLVVHETSYKFMIMRNAVRQELDAPYVITALSKGLTDRRVLFGHIVKNTLPPYVSVVAMNIGFMAGGALLVEVVFSWQGMGTLIYNAVLARDYPMLAGTLVALGLCVMVANLAADLSYALTDPRIREGEPIG